MPSNTNSQAAKRNSSLEVTNAEDIWNLTCWSISWSEKQRMQSVRRTSSARSIPRGSEVSDGSRISESSDKSWFPDSDVEKVLVEEHVLWDSHPAKKSALWRRWIGGRREIHGRIFYSNIRSCPENLGMLIMWLLLKELTALPEISLYLLFRFVQAVA